MYGCALPGRTYTGRRLLDPLPSTLVGQIRDGGPRLVLAVWEQVLLLPRGVGYVGQYDVLLGRLA